MKFQIKDFEEEVEAQFFVNTMIYLIENRNVIENKIILDGSLKLHTK